MNHAQNKIIQNWILLSLFICVLTAISISESENKLLLNLLIGGPFFIYLSSRQDTKHQKGYGINSVTMREFIEENIILKLWLVVFCVFILPFIIYNLYVGSTISGWLYALALTLLIGPLFITSEMQRFKHAGKMPNKSFQPDP